MKKQSNVFVTGLFWIMLLANTAVHGANDIQGDVPLSTFPGITYASIATESEKPTSEAPAVISVITAEDLHNHGITSLEQALEEVPGVYSPFRFLNGNFVFRGTLSTTRGNPEVLLLVDGMPQNDYFAAVHQRFITRIPIANINRIEIIRGPGSVVYGADAFSGVINIITKTDRDYEKTELRGRVGSYDTVELDGVFKGNLGNTKTLLSLQLRTTDGHEPLILEDTQTYFDNVFNTNSSLAPGEARTFFEEINASLEFLSKHLRTRFQVRDHRLGMGMSFLNALTETGQGEMEQYNLDIFYSNPDAVDNWIIKSNVSLFFAAGSQNKPFLPPGAVNGVFPDGVIDNYEQSDRNFQYALKAFYQGYSDHDILLGVGVNFIETSLPEEQRNYEIIAGGFSPIGSLQEQAPDQRLLKDSFRRVSYFLAHDDWNIARDFIFSFGARFDNYSDFGETFNPRIALIWLNDVDLTTKFIVNRAFRAPTFIELYGRNNVVIQGNSRIDPVSIWTYEIVLEKKFDTDVQLNASIFTHRVTDNIEGVFDTNGLQVMQNSNDAITGNGLEIEVILPVKDDINFKSSYSYQHNERRELAYYNVSPHHKIYVGIDWQFKRNWNLYTNILWVNDFTRDPADPRTDIGASSFVGAVLRYTSPTKRWDSYLSVRNIFDEEAVSPSDDYRFLPNDYPLPGTNFMAEVLYRM